MRVDRAEGECVVSGTAEQVVLAGIAVREAMQSGGAPPGGGGGWNFGRRDEDVPRVKPEAEELIACSGFEGRIIGKGGETIRRLQSEFGVRINVDSANGECTVSGSGEAVSKAVAALYELMEEDRGGGGGGGARGIKKPRREDDGDDGGGEYGPRAGLNGLNGLNGEVGLEQNLPPPLEPNFGLSGALAKETNTVNGVTLVYTEPVDTSKPPVDTKYRLYVFKDGQLLKDTEPLRVHRQSYYLFGRDRAVADIPTDHPSCSKQHAVLQYRSKRRFDDERGLEVTESVPYLMDLEATNGTFLNNRRIEPRRYYQLLPKDCVRFGTSTREYCVLSEDAASSGKGKRKGGGDA